MYGFIGNGLKIMLFRLVTHFYFINVRTGNGLKTIRYGFLFVTIICLDNWSYKNLFKIFQAPMKYLYDWSLKISLSLMENSRLTVYLFIFSFLFSHSLAPTLLITLSISVMNKDNNGTESLW